MHAGIFAFFLFLAAPSVALAGYETWTVEKENDHFSGNTTVFLDYVTRQNQAVVIICDRFEGTITVSLIPNEQNPVSADENFEMLFAFDGKTLPPMVGTMNRLSSGRAAVTTVFRGEEADGFARAFSNIKDKIAMKDGTGSRMYVMTADGALKAGTALLQCMMGRDIQ